MKTILIADDNAVSRELIREALNDEYIVLEAQDGLSAVNRFHVDDPDLALIDIQMPELDGFAVLEKIRQEATQRRVPVVALTAFAMQGDREKALQAGFDAYLTKPVNIMVLRTQIRLLLQG